MFSFIRLSGLIDCCNYVKGSLADSSVKRTTDVWFERHQQYKGKYLCKGVIEILTLCRIHEIFFQKYHEKAEIQSFPTMYMKGGVFLWSKWLKTRIFSKRRPEKQLFRVSQFWIN